MSMPSRSGADQDGQNHQRQGMPDETQTVTHQHQNNAADEEFAQAMTREEEHDRKLDGGGGVVNAIWRNRSFGSLKN